MFLIKNKSDAFEKFKSWKILVENLTDKRLKTLRTDNGLEFCNDVFDKYCKSEGIPRHHTVRKTPQQNGVAERMNRTLLDKSGCMLFSAGLPKNFWGEAVVTAAYLVNRSPSSAIEFKTPEEVWTGKTPDISHLRVFGCSAYAHQKEGKLDPRAVKCVFLGFPEGTKGYRLWLKGDRGFKTINSRDVVFHETDFPCLNESSVKRTDISGSTNHAGTTSIEVSPRIASTGQGSDRANKPEESMEHRQEDCGEHSSSEVRDEAYEDLPQSPTSYQLVRDRERRASRPVERYGFSAYTDLLAYAFFSEVEIQRSEPETYDQAVKCS